MAEGQELGTAGGQRFWQSFSAASIEVKMLIRERQMRQAFDLVDRLLRAHGFAFSFDLTSAGNDDSVFVLTPEGNRDQADQIDALLRQRPYLPGWQIFGRRQRKPVADALAFVRRIWERDVSDASFDLERRGEGWHLTMHSSGFRGLSDSQREGVVGTFLDHALGESVVMEKIWDIQTQDAGRGTYSFQDVENAITSNTSA